MVSVVSEVFRTRAAEVSAWAARLVRRCAPMEPAGPDGRLRASHPFSAPGGFLAFSWKVTAVPIAATLMACGAVILSTASSSFPPAGDLVITPVEAAGEAAPAPQRSMILAGALVGDPDRLETRNPIGTASVRSAPDADGLSVEGGEAEAAALGGSPAQPERAAATDEAVEGPREAAPALPQRSLTQPRQAAQIQQQLANLGFLQDRATGVWDARSRQALRAFKEARKLSPDESWDDATERALFGAQMPSKSFVGVWAPKADACPPQPDRRGLLPAVITDEGAWAGEVSCAFKNVRQTGEGWGLVATCSNVQQRWTSAVRLNVDGNRLTWTSQRGTQNYVRCQRGASMAQVNP